MCTHTRPHSFIHTPHTRSLSYTGTHTHTYSLTHHMSFLIAVVTNCHKRGDLLSGSSGGQKSPGISPGQDQGCIPSGGSRRGFVSCLFQLLEAPTALLQSSRLATAGEVHLL